MPTQTMINNGGFAVVGHYQNLHPSVRRRFADWVHLRPPPGLTITPTTGLRTTESGRTAIFTVRLATEPAGAVELTLASSNTAEGIVAPTTLTFAAANWNTARPVTLTGVDDDMATPPNPADGTTSYMVTLTVNQMNTMDVLYDGMAAVTLTAFNQDNEFGLDVGVVTGQATEAGGQATFPVDLLTAPTAAVTVTVTSAVPTEGVAAPGRLVFTPQTWETAQTVVVTGVDDAVDDWYREWEVRLTTASADADYHGRDESVTGRTTDDDNAPTVTLVLTPPTVTENGGVATVTATLSYPSIAVTTVTVTAAAVSPAVAGDFMQTGTELVIAAAQTTSTGLVTLTAANNDVDADDKRVTVAGTATNARATADGMTVSVTPATLTLEDDDERGFAFNPAVQLEVAAGNTAAYTVQLTSEPTGTVTITLDPEDGVMVAPPGLPFTATSWQTAQSVTVTVAAGTTGPISRVRHEGAGGGYEGVMKTLVVTRMRVDEEEREEGEPLTLTGEPRRVFVNGHLITVTVEGDVPTEVLEEMRIELRRPFTESLMTIRPLSYDQAKTPVGSRFGIGSAESYSALDIAVVPNRPGRLCLPVSDALVAAAAGKDLVLVREGEKVEGSKLVGSRVCGDVPTFSLFAVGYENPVMAFPVETKDFDFRTGREESMPLPAVERGNPPVTYTLREAGGGEAALPAWLVEDSTLPTGAEDGMLSGTATAPATYEYRLLATDVDGDRATLPFTIEVKPGIESRDLALVLAGIGRTLASDAVEILGSRAVPTPSRLHVTLGGQVLRLTEPAGSAPAASPSASGTPSPLASAPSPLAGEGRGEGAIPAATSGPSPWQRVTGVAVGVARALGVTLDTPDLPSAPAGAGQSEGSIIPSAQRLLARAPADPRRPASPTWRSPLSIQPVSAKDLLARSAFELPLTRTDADGLPTWTLWGRGAASGFAGEPEEGFKMDGTLYSGYLGLDYRQASLLMGLAVAHSTGTVDYERTGGTKAGVDVKLTSLLPYAHWQPRPGLGLWGLLGAGWGEMDLKAAGDPHTYTTTLTSWLGAVGGRQALTTWQGIDLAAKTDAFLTTLRSEAKTNLPGARGHAERVRLLLEGQTAVDLSPVSRVQPRLEVGGRWDSGTAEQGLGLELGGGLAYTQTEWGLSVDMQGRYLLVHQDGAFEDWGASVNVRLDPGIGGEGAYLTVAPVWGQPGSGVEQVWGNAAAVPGGTPSARAAGWRPGNVEIDVGYGLALADGRGLLTPYGGLVLGDPGTARYRLGSRWALSTLLELNIEGERAEQPGQAAAHGVSVRLGWQW